MNIPLHQMLSSDKASRLFARAKSLGEAITTEADEGSRMYMKKERTKIIDALTDCAYYMTNKRTDNGRGTIAEDAFFAGKGV